MQRTSVVITSDHTNPVWMLASLISPAAPQDWIRRSRSLFTVSFRWAQHDGWSYLDYSPCATSQILERCDGLQRFGASNEGGSRGGVYASVRASGAAWNCFLYPKLKRRLSAITADWLLEPMPETWFLWLEREPGYGKEIPLHQLEEGMFGPQPLRLPVETDQQPLVCYAALRISDGTRSRLEWLWDVRRLEALRSVNPFSPSCRWHRTTPAMLFRDRLRPYDVLVISSQSKRSWYVGDLPAALKPALYLQGDYAAMLSTLAGFTTLELEEVVAMAFTWWMDAGFNLVPLLSTSVARETSMLLLTDMVARLDPLWQQVLLDTLPAWKPFRPLNEIRRYLDTLESDDMRYLILTDARWRTACLGTHSQVYNTLRVVLSQAGVPLSNDPSGYVHALNALRSGGTDDVVAYPAGQRQLATACCS